MKDIQHKIIAIYRRGLLVVTGHAPEGNLLLIRYMSISAYIPITAPIINDPLLTYTKIFVLIKSNPSQIIFFPRGLTPLSAYISIIIGIIIGFLLILV